jgi:TonB family protein
VIEEDPAPPAPAAAPPPLEPERPAETRAEQPAAPKLDWRIIVPIAVAIVLLVSAAAFYFATRPEQQVAQPEQPASSAAEDAWAGLADYDRLSVRPLTMPRPIPTVAMQETMLSGFVDVDFTVGPDGKATDVRIIRESVEDIGYAREARRMVAGATWPTEWRGRAAPYAARFRVIFPPGRGAARVIAPISIASPNLTPEILALRRNASVTLLVRVNAAGLVESAQAIGADVESAAVIAEALRVAMGARFPPSSAGVGYETRLVVHFNVLGALGQSEEPPPGPVVSLSEVPFAQRPSDSDFTRHYPNRALRQGMNGRVTLDCTVRRDLRLNCLIATEDPPNEGFGSAALRIARRFRAERQFPDGRTTIGAQVTVPMAFRVE